MGVRKRREAGCEGRKEDPRGEVHCDKKLFIFVLFCLQRSKIVFPMILEWTPKRGRDGMCKRRKRGGRAPDLGVELGLGQGHRRSQVCVKAGRFVDSVAKS